MNLAFSLREKTVNDGLKNLRKQHVNGEKRMVATKPSSLEGYAQESGGGYQL